MRRMPDKPSSIRRDCLPGFRGGRLAVLLAKTEAGNAGTTGLGRPVRAEIIVQNEPNSSIADCGLGIVDWGQTCGGTPAPWLRFAHFALWGPADQPNWVRFAQSASPARDAEPIRPERPEMGADGRGHRGRNVQNKANSHQREPMLSVGRKAGYEGFSLTTGGEKQSQFAGSRRVRGSRRTGKKDCFVAWLLAMTDPGERAKVQPARRGGGGVSVQNKANSRRSGWVLTRDREKGYVEFASEADGEKQSQFGRGPAEQASYLHAGDLTGIIP
jgi:hypothetical protein